MASQKRYVFGYGSILNPASMAKDIDARTFYKWTTLSEYERIFNVAVDGSLALNIRPAPGKAIDGILIEADEKTFQALVAREKGYYPLDVTEHISGIDGQVVAFVAPEQSHPDLKISKDYYDLCINAIPPQYRDMWLKDTIIENQVSEE